jgi:hypothetical protein
MTPEAAMLVAALFVETDGVYYGLPGVDPWDEKRDARLYAGPWPVVAHPPCARWGRYWYGGPTLHKQGKRKILGDDAGCFASALASVRKWGGVLEHPEGTHAWRRYGIPSPPRSGGWIACLDGGWTCCVEQGHYGHRARKATWLYSFGMTPPPLKWGKSEATIKLEDSYHSADERRRGTRTGACQRMGHRERAATPVEFRDVLIGIARMATHDP